MNNFFASFTVGFIVGVIALAIFISVLGKQVGIYQEGQIDAINGKIYYELQKQDDNTTEWIYVPDGVSE